jgi:hypothetical protein
MRSLFAITYSIPNSAPWRRNVSAGPAGGTALQAAIDAAAAAAPGGATFQSAQDIGGRPADYAITAAVSPATDGTPQGLYTVSFQNGSGAGGTTPAPALVWANPQTGSGVTTRAEDLAIVCAATNASATPNACALVGTVDISA